MINKKSRVVFDTNIWISFLIGKRLAKIKQYISNGSLIIVTTEKLLIEIKEVTFINKLKKYFSKEDVNN